jgi:hypothetical protein
MVLAYMSCEQQQLLQGAFVRLRDGLEDAAADGGWQIECLMVALDPAQQLLAELPHNSLPPPGLGPDTYDEQRRSLTVEVSRDTEEEQLDEGLARSRVRVEWLDGTQMRVA